MQTDFQHLELEFFRLFQKTPDLVCVADKAGFFKIINDAVIEKLGYSKEELFSKPISSFIHPEDKELTSLRRSELLSGKALLNFQNRYLKKNAEVIWLHWTSIYFPDKEIVFAIAKDITETKLIEKEIEEQYRKFKNLALHFKTSLEKDRKYLALELHEELAQLASVVKMDIQWISENFPKMPLTGKKRLDHALAVSDSLINGLRRITYAISPNMLEDLGLNDTLKWLSEDFALMNGISCRYFCDYNVEELPHEIQLDFFRICQEALNNVSAHAKAASVKVQIRCIGENICLSIVDDGVGFFPAQVKKSSGLTSMKKRAASINGELTVNSEPGKGTQVCLSVRQPVH
jgi:PAS domain S-box-containing protein